MEPLDGVVPYPPEFAARYRARGYWEDRTLDEVFGELFARTPVGSPSCTETRRSPTGSSATAERVLPPRCMSSGFAAVTG
jgi:hypothetical protein